MEGSATATDATRPLSIWSRSREPLAPQLRGCRVLPRRPAEALLRSEVIDGESDRTRAPTRAREPA